MKKIRALALFPRFFILGLLISGWSPGCLAAGGPLGIDHRLSHDDSGVWKHSNQTRLIGLMVAGEALGALWQGGETRLGKTYWQAIDSTLLGTASSEVLKRTFTRERPIQENDPNKWFQGKGHYSFPSSEVSAITSIVTPFILEYRHDAPSVYALELLPAYVGVARMKAQAHWQTDVLAGFALGTLSGYYAHNRESPIVLGVLPHGFSVGLRKQW